MVRILDAFKGFVLVSLAGCVLSAGAQSPLRLEDAPGINQLFGVHTLGGSLKCSFERKKPTLDYSLRFHAGYIVNCAPAEFGGKETPLMIYARITPEGKAPILLGEVYHLPALPPDTMARADRNSFFEMSGGFRVGEGSYLVEILVVDDRHRIFQRHWRITAARHGRRPAAQLLIRANTVEPLLGFPKLELSDVANQGFRLTLILDAAPIDPFKAKLRAWERASLLNALWALIVETHCHSIRVVAFNFVQQREIFRQDRFDRTALTRLAQVLGDLEMATVSVESLSHQRLPDEFLARLVNQEFKDGDPPEALVFLGPTTRFANRVRPQLLEMGKNTATKVFNFELYSGQGSYPADTMVYLTRALNGVTYKIYTPDDFRKAIQQMIETLKWH
jgi:hypothetical protein